MAIINYSDFANIAPQDNGVGGLLEHFNRGDEIRQSFKTRRQDEEAKRQMIEQLMLSNRASGVKNEFLPRQLEQDMKQNAAKLAYQELVNKFLPQEKQAGIGLTNQQARAYQLKNALEEQFGAPERQADLARKQFDEAQARKKAEIIEGMLSGDGRVMGPNQDIVNSLLGIKNPEREAYLKNRGIDTAKFEGEVARQLPNLYDAQDSLNYIGDVINGNEELLKQSSGKIDSVVGKYFGKDAQKKLLAEIDAASGRLVLSTLKNISGAISNKELDFASSIKLSKSDTPAAFIAKYNALRAFNDIEIKRLNLISDNINNGMSRHDAIKDAKERTNSSDIIKSYRSGTDSYSYQNSLGSKTDEELLSALGRPE